MTTQSSKQKLYCFVDETGQDTKGELFIVSVVVAQSEYEQLELKLERIEESSGKGKVKWREAKDSARVEYIRQVLDVTSFGWRLTYNLFHDTRDYLTCTVFTVAQSVAFRSEDAHIVVFVDGLPKSRVKWFGAELRRLNVPVRKVRGVRKEESSSLIRLADALCGFVRAALTGRTDLEALLTQAREQGVIIEL